MSWKNGEKEWRSYGFGGFCWKIIVRYECIPNRDGEFQIIEKMFLYRMNSVLGVVRKDCDQRGSAWSTPKD